MAVYASIKKYVVIKPSGSAIKSPMAALSAGSIVLSLILLPDIDFSSGGRIIG
jgi:hypothetical protein